MRCWSELLVREAAAAAANVFQRATSRTEPFSLQEVKGYDDVIGARTETWHAEAV